MPVDALSKIPPILRQWAEKKGLDKLLRKYGWSICHVCGRIGYRFSTEMVPSGHDLEFESLIQGWIHPPGDGWDGGEQEFRARWQAAEREEQTIPESLMGDFFRFVHERCVQHNRPVRNTHGPERGRKDESIRLLRIRESTDR